MLSQNIASSKFVTVGLSRVVGCCDHGAELADRHTHRVRAGCQSEAHQAHAVPGRRGDGEGSHGGRGSSGQGEEVNLGAEPATTCLVPAQMGLETAVSAMINHVFVKSSCMQLFITKC